jgi:hypothetical protein
VGEWGCETWAFGAAIVFGEKPASNGYHFTGPRREGQLSGITGELPPAPVRVTMKREERAAMKLTCHACNGTMVKKTISSGNCAGLALALITLCAGVVIFFLIPVLGWVIGPAICLCALFMGGKRSKVWRCRSCGSIIARA